MTKNIRIENADTSDHKVRVYTEDYDALNDVWVRVGEPVVLDYPTAMAQHYIHATRRLVIEELK